jgi:type 1 glutamine amidotransferase
MILALLCSFPVASNPGRQAALPAPGAAEPPSALIVTGANNHDWRFTTLELKAALEQLGSFRVRVSEDPARELADASFLEDVRVLVLNYNGPRWGEAAEANFLAAVRAGAGVVVVHAANNAFPGWSEYETLVGDLWRSGSTGHGKYHAFDVEIVDRDHPITRGLPKLRAHFDELYHGLVRTPGTSHRVLAVAYSSPESGGTGRCEPMILVAQFGQGRVFHTPLGHVWPDSPETHKTFEEPQFDDLLLRGALWAATGQVEIPPAYSDNALSDREVALGWKLLFDGRTTAGWRSFRGASFPESGWRVLDGALHHDAGGGGGDLVTTEEYGDFELEFEWKVAPKGNSGVMVRVTEDQEQTYFSGPEYQVLDDAGHELAADDWHSAGGLYELAKPLGKVLRPTGQWNQGRIVVQGWRIEHWLNGARLLQLDLSDEEGRARIAASKFKAWPSFAGAKRGRIALQDHGDEVAYRNLKLRELPPSRVALFNGRDLAGWQGILPDGTDPSQVWSVADGVLTCSGTPAGYLRTTADYENYVLELEWRWQPDGPTSRNSGVLLRMIGPDGIWPKSLEAQLQSKSAGDFWVIQEFPCKTAPERTKGRHCAATASNEKPLGEWNHYRIRVDHGEVVLEVNGRELNRASDVQQTPGKICLQSEGAPIQFRNVWLTPVE